MTPLTRPVKNDSKIKDAGVVLHVQEEVYQLPLNLIKDKYHSLGLTLLNAKSSYNQECNIFLHYA